MATLGEFCIRTFIGHVVNVRCHRFIKEHIYAIQKVSRLPFVTPYNPSGKYVVRLYFLVSEFVRDMTRSHAPCSLLGKLAKDCCRRHDPVGYEESLSSASNIVSIRTLANTFVEGPTENHLARVINSSMNVCDDRSSVDIERTLAISVTVRRTRQLNTKKQVLFIV
jgi:hypothetical protein